MNCFKFNQISIGDSISFKYEINTKKMKMFKEITGDENPLHCNIDFAQKHNYEEEVIYGMLTASVFSTVAGMYLPGELSLIHKIEVSFIKPVYISKCPLTINAQVVDKDDRFEQITVKVIIFDNTNTKVTKGKISVGFIK